MDIQISISPIVAQAAPGLQVGAILATVTNHTTSDALWAEISAAGDELRATTPLDRVNKRLEIASTRAAYKRLGKEPNRYRPSAEALCRRLVKGMDLYRTLSVIDAINLISIRSGHSIGGFDRDKISGSALVLGRGEKDEPFEAIGRGSLNIEGLPVYRDSIGGIGTPTSDHERTKLTPQTTRLLMLINSYGSTTPLPQTVDLAIEVLRRHCFLSSVESTIITP